MIIALTGDNSLMLRTELDALVTPFVAMHGDISLERLDGETASFERIQESLQSSPFFAEKKMVVLRVPSANKQFVEHAERLLHGMPASTDIVIVEPKLDKRGTYYKFLKKVVELREFSEPEEAAVAPWLVATVKASGGSLTLADARYLVERVGANQQQLAQELEKLLIYAPAVTRETIERLTEQTPQGTIFELLEVAFAGNPSMALNLYRDQRAQKVDTTQIVAMLTWQLRILVLIKAGTGRSPQDIASAAKLNPYVIRKSQSLGARLNLAQLKRLVADLLRIDVRSKRERIDIDEALQNFLLALAEM